jgi:hypothetical protein
VYVLGAAYNFVKETCWKPTITSLPPRAGRMNIGIYNFFTVIAMIKKLPLI